MDCFDCFRLAPGKCDRHSRLPRMTNCWDCGDSLPMAEARQIADHMYCQDCADLQTEFYASCEAEAEYDTPSLQDTDPEGHRYITNNYGAGY